MVKKINMMNVEEYCKRLDEQIQGIHQKIQETMIENKQGR
jgi:ribosomal protein L23